MDRFRVEFSREAIRHAAARSYRARTVGGRHGDDALRLPSDWRRPLIQGVIAVRPAS